ncbi:MAG: hypothetical protein RLY20_2334 [Verrucomicrobiota bacterium]
MRRQIAALLLVLASASLQAGSPPTNYWRGVHLWVDKESAAQSLIKTLPDLAKVGVNTLILEVNYSFEFSSHPELRNVTFIRRTTAVELSAAAKTNGIRLIPEFNCLGHQSFGQRIEPLLKQHPDFSETPSLMPTNKDVYCLSWCPRAPGLQEIVVSLLDEIADGFNAEALHVGMDEVYLLAAAECPRCREASPARLFSEQVNALHDHIVTRRKRQMLMWSDRVIGTQYQGAARFDNEHNDTSTCIDDIPRDIIQCDWHYEWKRSYPSLRYLTSKGFQVWPAGFQPLAASRAFSSFARAQSDPRIVGYLATTWNETPIKDASRWPPISEVLADWK